MKLFLYFKIKIHIDRNVLWLNLCSFPRYPNSHELPQNNSKKKGNFGNHHQYLLSEQCEPQILFKYFACVNLIFENIA